MAPLYGKQFCPCFVFSRGGLILNTELRTNLRYIVTSLNKEATDGFIADVGLLYQTNYSAILEIIS